VSLDVSWRDIWYSRFDETIVMQGAQTADLFVASAALTLRNFNL
jgi:hypothetical protein